MTATKGDVLTPEQRRRCMSRIRGRNTKPELALRRALWVAGLRYRIHYPMVGKPDIVFVRRKIAVFVDGCFWHGCPEHATHPKTNARFWAAKLEGNRKRDQRITAELEAEGWRVLRFWEHELKEDLDSVAARVVDEFQACQR